jgi:hypothetical protein
MRDAKRILQPVAGATGKKAKAADLILEKMRSPREVWQRFPEAVTKRTVCVRMIVYCGPNPKIWCAPGPQGKPINQSGLVLLWFPDHPQGFKEKSHRNHIGSNIPFVRKICNSPNSSNKSKENP